MVHIAKRTAYSNAWPIGRSEGGEGGPRAIVYANCDVRVGVGKLKAVFPLARCVQ